MALDPVSAGLDLVNSIVTRVWPDASEADRARAATALTALQGQLAVNEAEARNPSVWTSGWRPGVGWVCVAAFAWRYVGYPVVSLGCALWAPGVHLPDPSIDPALTELLIGMLGLGGLRTVEKMKGVAR